MKRLRFHRRSVDVPAVAAGLVLGAALATLVAVGVSRWQGGRRRLRSSEQLDHSLDATYPASDPPASQYYDIPANRD